MCLNSHAASVGFSAASYNSMEPEQTTPEDRERQRQILDATIESILPRDYFHWLRHHSWDEFGPGRYAQKCLFKVARTSGSRCAIHTTMVALFCHLCVAKSKWQLNGTFLHYQHHNSLQNAYSRSGNHYIKNLRTCCMNSDVFVGI